MHKTLTLKAYKSTWVQTQNTEYKLKQYKLKVLKVSPFRNDEKLLCTWNIYTCNLKHLHKTHYILKNVNNIQNKPKFQKASIGYKFKNKHQP